VSLLYFTLRLLKQGILLTTENGVSPFHFMKETSRRRIAVTSSLNEISTDQLGNRVVVRGEARRCSDRPSPLSPAGFWTDM